MTGISRRQFLIGGTAATAIAAGASGAAVALRGGGGPRSSPSPTTAPTTMGTAVTSATPGPARGGIARVHSPAAFNFDTFDVLKTGEPSVIEVLGRTHVRLVDWLEPGAAVLGPALASRWEQPDSDRLLLHLDPTPRWQPGHPLAGEPVQPDQVRAFLRRAIELARAGRMPAIQRPQDWDRIRSVTTPGNTVAIQTDGPDPFLLHTLASRFALVQAPEAVQAFEATWQELTPASAAGCGPFIYSGSGGGNLRFSAHASGPNQPLLDGLEVTEPVDVAARFSEGALDEAILRDRRDAPALRQQLNGGITESVRYEESPVISTLFVGAPPWDNPDLRLALNAALNRPELARRLFGGRATACGPVSPAHAAFALPESDTTLFPGFRADFATDFAEARRRWMAGGGAALGAITVDIPSIFDPPYGASAVVTEMLHEALGTEVIARVDTYAAISARAAAHQYGNGNASFWFGWGPPLVEPDPSRSLIEIYGSVSPTYGTTGYRSAAVDLALARLATVTDVGERKENVKHIQRLLLADGCAGVVPWLLQGSEVMRHAYYTAPPPSAFWTQQLSRFIAIDPADPSFQIRNG